MSTQVIVIGATSAVAQAAVRLWAARQATITLVGRNAEELARIAADAVVRGAENVVTVVGDLMSSAFIATTVAAFTPNGNAQALIAHGSLTDSVRADTDLDYLAGELQTNFVSAALWAQALAERFARAGRGSGVIAVISSVAGDRGRGSNHAYGAAKAGLTAYCSGLRARMHAYGVHVVTVKPGFIDSPMTAHIARKGALWASPDAIATGIIKAIDNKRDVVYLPSFWRAIMLIIEHVPEGIFKRLKF